ncbi:ABC transporter substrate-binding protein [Desulfosporosinus lacus]|uniref:Peptide/nickel transport system substrate-binding protein n=1 Tax=Desulfosporosinus lacus DSM 15449 TaxID=1121420 RepID=A0A1M6A3Y7_9FIRM|nr:ABC transporter substrate-binding protein [Desulfosporosinus lacus]SHI31049.1 peptide/nickel transport system substrate-binding protein [Desulfosporosinus lacus DSM 15449]
MRRVLVLIISILVLTSLAGCAKSANAPQESSTTQDKSLVIATAADLGTIDPAVAMDNSAWKISYPAYERLVNFKGSSTEVEPGLAKSWSISPDGLTWTFILQENHKFADGTSLDAAAVKYSFDRLMKIKKGPSDAFPSLESVTVVDPHTVVFKLKTVFPAFLSTLATNGGGIVNPAVMKEEKDGDLGQSWLANHTAGSGPYVLSEWIPEQSLKLTANPNYSGEKPNLATINVKIIKDPSSQRMALEKGDVDIAENIPVDQLKELKSNQDLVVFNTPSLMVDYVYLNTQKPGLNNPKVRQAISYAIDYQGIISSVWQGNATQMRGPVPQGLWGYQFDLFQYTKNVEKAKSLLQEAGVKDLTLNFMYSDNKAWWEQEAQIIQNNLSEIGIKVNLQKIAYAAQREKIDAGDFDLTLGVWSPDYADPYMFMNYWFDSDNFGLAGNRAFYKNDQVDQLVRKAASVNDQAQRTDLYKQAQELIVQDAPYVFLVQKNYQLPMRKSVQGFVFNPMLQDMYNFEMMNK